MIIMDHVNKDVHIKAYNLSNKAYKIHRASPPKGYGSSKQPLGLAVQTSKVTERKYSGILSSLQVVQRCTAFVSYHLYDMVWAFS